MAYNQGFDPDEMVFAVGQPLVIGAKAFLRAASAPGPFPLWQLLATEAELVLKAADEYREPAAAQGGKA